MHRDQEHVIGGSGAEEIDPQHRSTLEIETVADSFETR